MATNNEDIKWLYGKLKSKGYNIGTEEEFSSSLANEADRQWYYEKANGMGLKVGSMDDFNSIFAPAQVADGAETGAAPEAQQGAWEPTEQDKMRTSLQIHTILNDFNERSRERVAQAQRVSEPLTAEGRKKRRVIQGQVIGTPKKLPGITPPAVAPASDGVEGDAQQPTTQSGQSPVPYGVKYVDGKPVAQWLLPDGRITTDITEADQAEYGARAVRLREQFEDRMRQNGLDPEKEEDVVEQNINDALSINERKIREIYDRRSREFDEGRDMQLHDGESRWDRFVHAFGSTVNSANSNMHPAPRGTQTGIPEGHLKEDDVALENLLAEKQMLEEGRKRLRASSGLKKSEGRLNGLFDFRNNARNFNAGVKDKLTDADFFGGGIIKAQQADRLISIENKLKNNEQLTDTDLSLVYASMLNGNVNRLADTPHGYNAGQITTEMVPFMIQMAANPASGLSKALVKKFGTNRVKKLLATVAGDVTESAVLANTLQLPSTIGEIETSYIGDATKNADGEIEFDGCHDWAEATAKGQGAAIITNYTEKLGEHFSGIGKFLGKTSSTVAKKAGLGKVVNNVGELVSKIKANDWVKAISDIESRAQWNGPIYEVLEEESDIVLNSLFVGDNSLSDLVDKEQQIDILLGVGLFGGFVSGIKTVGYPIARYKAKKNLDDADKNGQFRFASEWDGIRETIDIADEQQLSNVVISLAKGKAQSNEQAQSIAAYASALMKSRGYNLAKASKRAEGMTSPEEDAAESSYDNGRELYERYEQGDETAQPEVDATALRMQEAYDVFNNAFGAQSGYYMARMEDPKLTEEQRASAPWELLEDPELTEEKKDAVLYYINAKAALDGVMDASNEAADRKREEVVQSVKMRTHKNNGMIIPAETTTGKQVYIVSGNVMMNPDGKGVDKTNSSNQFYIFNPETGKYESSAPEFIENVGEAVNPQDEVRAAHAIIEQEQMSVFGENAVAPEISENISGSGNDSVILPTDNGNYGDRPEQNNDTASGSNGGDTLRPVVADATGGLAPDRDRGAIRGYEEGLANQHYDGTEYSERDRREAESERLVGIARANGQYFDREKKSSLGVRYPKGTGESEVYISRDSRKIYKVKNPYAKSPLKGDVQPEDAIFEHLVHNKYFPETAYGFEGISDDTGEARIILSQDFVESVGQPTQEQIEKALGAKGLYPEGKYRYGNDEVSVTDVTGDNALLGADGNVYFIDPIIDFKKPVREILGENAVAPAGEAATVPESAETVPNSIENPEISAENGENFTGTVPKAAETATEPQRTALSRIPVGEEGEPLFEAVDRETAWDGLVEAVGGENDAAEIAMAQVQQASADLETLKKKPPTMKAPKLKGSPMAMAQAKREAAEKYQAELARYNQQIADMQGRLDAWNGIIGVHNSRNAELERQQAEERRQLEAAAQAEAAARFEEQQRIKAEKEAEAEQQEGNETVDQATLDAGTGAESEIRVGQYTGRDRQRTDNLSKNEITAQAEITASLSEETDDYGKPFVKAKNGSTDFGTIDSESGLAEAPIKLSLGENYTDENGKNHGYGLIHIEAGHGTQIRHAGFSSVEEFVESVATNYETIREGNRYGDKPTYLLEAYDGHNNTLFIQLSNDGMYWNVNSAGIFREKYSRRKPEVKPLPTIGNSSNTETAEVNHGQNEGATATSGNSSTTSDNKVNNSVSDKQAESAKSLESTKYEPTEAQKAAGNYKMEHRRVDGYNISIENAKGSVRRGKDADGKAWESTMQNDYGYIRGTEGVDGDHIDVFLSDTPEEGDVFVVDQVNEDGSFDEHKVMYGFPSEEAAREAYLSNYEQGWTGLGAITHVSKDEFKKWIQSSRRKTKPFAEYKSVNVNSEIPTRLKYDRTIPTSPEEQRSAISRIIDFAKNIKNRVERAVIGGITTRQEKDFANIGVSVDNTWVHSFESSAVNHNQKHHGNAENEEARGQIAITSEDYGKIPDILEDYDRISKSPNKTKGTENEVIIYEKEFDDGYIYYLEEKRDNRKSLAFHTMYKKKKGTDSSDGFAVNSTAPITPKATPDNLDSNSDDKVNTSSADKQAESAESSSQSKAAETVAENPKIDNETTESGERKVENGEGNRYRDGGEMSEGERLRAIRALVPIEVERNDMSKAELREVYNNLPAVEKDGREIEFYHSAFKKIYKEGGLFSQVVPILDEILERSVLAYSERDNLGGTVRPDGTIHKEHDNIIAFDNYVGSVEIDGKRYFVRTTVQNEIGTSGTHAFFVSNVDVYENPTESRTIPITSRGTTNFNGIVDAKLQQFFERASSEANKLDMEDRVQELSERLGVPVRVISDESELSELSDDNKPRYSRREKRAKGWWSAQDNEIVIVLPNNVNVADVDNTFVHEVVGHYGLRKLVGDERFDDFLGEVYGHAPNSIRKDIDKKTDEMVNAEADRLRVRMAQAHERAGEDVNAHYYSDMAQARVEANARREDFRREATEEYMADMAGRIGSEGFEKMDREEQTLWGKIKAKVQEFLDKFLRAMNMPKRITLSDKDLSYILYKSWKNLRDSKGNGGIFAEAEDAVMRRRTGWDDAMLSESAKIEDANKSFNRQLNRYVNGDMGVNDYIEVGRPLGVMRMFLSDVPIVVRQRVLHKASVTKHNVDLLQLRDMPGMIARPIFVFQRDANTLGALTELRDRDGKNVCVAIELNRSIQSGTEFLEVNDIRSLHGRDASNIVLPIAHNNTLQYVDKKKGLAWLSSASSNYQQEIAKQDLDSAAKIIKNFENPTIEGVSQRAMLLNESSTPTSVTDGATLFGDAKLPKFFEYPTIEDGESSRFRDGTDYEERTPVMARAMQVSEKRARIEKLRKSEPIEISGEEIEYSPDIKQYKKNALEYGKKLQGEYVNEDRGKTIQLQRGRRNGGLKEVLQHDLSQKAHIQSVAAIPDIIRKSVYIETDPNRDKEKNPDVRGYEHYVCGLKIGGEDYTVHSIVAEDNSGNRYYDHKLSYIEKGRLLDFIEAKQPIEQILTPMSSTEPTIRSERKIKELISLLQVEDEEAVRRFRDGADYEERTPVMARAMQVSEKRARIEKLRKSEPVEVTDDMIPGNLDLNDRKAVKAALKELIRQTVVNEDNRQSISVFKDGINEVTSHGMTDPAHVKSLFAIPEMLRKSIYIDERINEKDHTDFEKYQYYVCGMKIDGEDYTAKIVVGVKGSDRYYDHRLSHIEKGKLINSLNGLSNSETEKELPKSDYKGMTLESLLQINDEKDEIVRRFRDGADYEERTPVMARAMYEDRVKSNLYQCTEAWQNSMLGLKEFYKAVESQGEKRDVEDVPSFENAYTAENELTSRSRVEGTEYDRQVFRPLMNIVAHMSGNEKGRQELIDYMLAKHGLERNAYMRNAAAAKDEVAGRDFAGLCGLTGKKDWAGAEIEAQRMVDDYESKYPEDIAKLWEAVNKATKTTLRKMYDSGLMSKRTYEKIRKMYQYYIPLCFYDEKSAEDVYGYLTGDKGFYSSPIEIEMAEGHNRKTADPLATIAYMAQNTIIQGNRNLMKQRFLMYVQNHPSDLASINRLWLKYDEDKMVWKPMFADIDESMTLDEIDKEVRAFERRMMAHAKAEPNKYKQGEDTIDIPYRVSDGNLKEHQIVVKRDGRTFVITINGNPRAAQAVNGLTNPDNDLKRWYDTLFGMSRAINRHLSGAYTTLNPEFVESNLFRDLIYSHAMVHLKENQGYALRFHKNHFRTNHIRMIRLLYLYENDKLDMRKRVHRMFYEYMHWGGETGYTMLRDLEAEKKYVKEIIKDARRGKFNPRRIFRVVCMGFDRLNRAIENSARFAAYITSRESGRDIQRSVYDAKEITVNFNRKGAGDKFLNAKGQTAVGKTVAFASGAGRSLYVFWSAGIQGVANVTKTFAKHPYKCIAAATSLPLWGLLQAALADGGDDDDENGYYNIPKYIRRSNIMIRSGKQWISIPLPVEFRGLFGLGVLLHEVISGREEYTGWELAKEISEQLAQILPLDFMEGGGGWHAFVPSSIKPAVEAYTNTSWTGGPIYRETDYNEKEPEWTKAYPRTNEYLVDLAKWASDATGDATSGNDYAPGWLDINPARLEYLLNGYLGGYFNTVNKLEKTGETLFGDREYDPKNILFVSRLVKMGDKDAADKKVRSEFHDYYDEYEDTHRLLRKYEADAERGIDKYKIFLDALKHSKKGERHDVMQEYVSGYRWLDRAIKDPETPEEDRAVFENNLQALKREAVSLLKVADDSARLTSRRKELGVHTERKDTRKLLEEYDGVAKEETRINKLRKANPEAYLKERQKLMESTDMPMHKRVRQYKQEIKELTERYLRAKTPEERNSITKAIMEAERRLHDDLENL